MCVCTCRVSSDPGKLTEKLGGGEGGGGGGGVMTLGEGQSGSWGNLEGYGELTDVLLISRAEDCTSCQPECYNDITFSNQTHEQYIIYPSFKICSLTVKFILIYSLIRTSI